MKLTGKELWKAYNGYLTGYGHTTYTWFEFKKLYPVCSIARTELEEKLFPKKEEIMKIPSISGTTASFTIIDDCSVPYSLGSCTTKAAPANMTATEVCHRYAGNIPSAKEDNMTTVQITEDTAARDARRYLTNRLWSVKNEKRGEATEKFNINGMPCPKTLKEVADRLAKGLYVIDGLDKNPEKSTYYTDLGDLISWRDPSKPADHKAYDAASEKIEAAAVPVEDAIAILPAPDALKILTDFETKDLLAN